MGAEDKDVVQRVLAAHYDPSSKESLRSLGYFQVELVDTCGIRDRVTDRCQPYDLWSRRAVITGLR